MLARLCNTQQQLQLLRQQQQQQSFLALQQQQQQQSFLAASGPQSSAATVAAAAAFQLQSQPQPHQSGAIGMNELFLDRDPQLFGDILRWLQM